MTAEEKDDIESYRSAFALFDKNGDGKITVIELRDVLQEIGQNPTEKGLLDMLAAADKNANGTIDFSEFVIMVKSQQNKPAEEQRFTVAFQAFDKDNSGYITVEELKQGIKTLAVELTPEEAENLMQECDTDSDGKISYEEFAKMMLSL